jgi:hypothetical protein
VRPKRSTVVIRARYSALAALCAAVVLAVASASAATETYVRATIDESGRLRIVTAAGRVILPKRLTTQVGFDKIAISPDGRVVGWVALYPNCCTSYPIPLRLVLYSNGKTRTLTGSGLPIWRWCFEADGRQVAFEQETVHSGIGIHYELRDVATGRLVDEYNPPPEHDGDAGATPRDVPKWVAELDAKK